MKINKEDIKSYAKYLATVPYDVVTENAVIFLPLNDIEEKEINGLTLTTNASNAPKKATAGLIISSNNDTPVQLAFADITYSSNFDLLRYLSILDKANKKDKEMLTDIECILVRKEYIFNTFAL